MRIRKYRSPITEEKWREEILRLLRKNGEMFERDILRTVSQRAGSRNPAVYESIYHIQTAFRAFSKLIREGKIFMREEGRRRYFRPARKR